MTENEEKYLNLYSIEKINSFASIDKKKKFIEGTAKNKYNSINHYIGIEIGFEKNIAENEAKKLEKKLKLEIKAIQEIYKRFNKSRQKDFNDNFKEFYDWFDSQEEECFYCKIQKKELEGIFKKKIITSKKFNSTLHIEKKDSKVGYNVKNMVLACALCNNAKSDMISKDDYETYFAEPMKKYLSQCKDKANA